MPRLTKSTTLRRTDDGKIIPEREDIDAVETEDGPLPKHPTKEQAAERYQLYQAQALVRWYNGQKKRTQ